MYIVAGPDPNPNPGGGGRLPNPNEYNYTLTSGTSAPTQTVWKFSKEEIKDPSRYEGCEKVGYEPGTS